MTLFVGQHLLQDKLGLAVYNPVTLLSGRSACDAFFRRACISRLTLSLTWPVAKTVTRHKQRVQRLGSASNSCSRVYGQVVGLFLRCVQQLLPGITTARHHPWPWYNAWAHTSRCDSAHESRRVLAFTTTERGFIVRWAGGRTGFCGPAALAGNRLICWSTRLADGQPG